ncbi:MAG: hypothetical protein NPIRA06_33180 [Nitrospirales bacterium]|nr:MAG: hypothetical protein NPIRA06_33180 [Nitrospirales bacterium]
MLSDHQASFELLARDLAQVLEFVEPVDANEATHSHRLFSLLLRICTDFESIAKELLITGECKKLPKEMTILDYRTLEKNLLLETIEVEFLQWRPRPRGFTPFKDWSTGQPPLTWYKAYNLVKHNRYAEFQRANLKVVVDALAGQFAILARVSNYNWPPCSLDHENGKHSFWREPFFMHWKD